MRCDEREHDEDAIEMTPRLKEYWDRRGGHEAFRKAVWRAVLFLRQADTGEAMGEDRNPSKYLMANLIGANTELKEAMNILTGASSDKPADPKPSLPQVKRTKRLPLRA
jgi:hypothetical protein